MTTPAQTPDFIPAAAPSTPDFIPAAPPQQPPAQAAPPPPASPASPAPADSPTIAGISTTKPFSSDWWKEQADVPPAFQPLAGWAKSVLRLPLGAAQIAAKATGLDKNETTKHALDWIDNQLKEEGVGEELGGGAEQAAELAGGEKLAKQAGAAIAARYFGEHELLQIALRGTDGAEAHKLAGQLSQVLEKSPRAAQLMRVGVEALSNIARSSGVAGTQQFVRSGGDVGEAEKAALLGGAGTTLAEGARVGVSAGTGRLMRKFVGSNDAMREATTNAATDILRKTGMIRPEDVAQGAETLPKAVDLINEKSVGLYKQIDDASGNTFSDLRSQEKKLTQQAMTATGPKRDEAVAALKSVQQDMQEMFDSLAAEGKVSRETLDNAKYMYRGAKVLNDVRDAVGSAMDQAKPGDLYPPINGNALMRNLNGLKLALGEGTQGEQLLQKYLGGSLQTYYDVAEATSKVEGRRDFQTIAKGVSAAVASGLVGGPTGYMLHSIPAGMAAGSVGGAIGVTAHIGTENFMHYLATHPNTANMVITGLQRGASMEYLIPAVTNTVLENSRNEAAARERQQQQMRQQQQNQPLPNWMK
jgi:hypothetical protein